MLPGKGVSNEKAFVETSTKALYEYMVLDGCENIFNTHVASHIGIATFCKASERRVLGSMNDMPMSMLEGVYPSKALLTLASLPKL